MTTFFNKGMINEYESIVAKLATRAENIRDLDGTFVETIFPEMIHTPQHQIIYGRRGTGKTHLLRRVESSLRENFSEGDILPVYVNGSQLSQEINIVSSDPAIVALAIYAQLMQHIGTEIRKFIGELNQANFWDKTVGGKKTQTARRADAIAAILEETLTSGQVRLLPTGEVSDEARTLAETSKNSSIGASLKIDPRIVCWAVKTGTAAERSIKTSSLTTRKIRGEVIMPFAKVAFDLKSLLELLGNATIHVLFDEWSEVNKDAAVQPYLAEMLRRTVSAVPGMYLKLACIPGRTRLAIPIDESIKNPIGLEEGDDIHPDVDLDSVVFADGSLEELIPFFIDMIKKHVGTRLEWVRYASIINFQSFLMSIIFSGEKPFLELCQASGGVPRDFINIYKKATTLTFNLANSNQARPPIDLGIVRLAAQSVYQSKRASFGRSASTYLRLLDSLYQEIYVKKHSYQFLLSEEDSENDIVQTLYMEKLIHRLPTTYYDPIGERGYQFFLLDYGTTIGRLMSDAAKDARASYESSVWIKMGSLGNKFLGRTSAHEIDQERNATIAAYIALFNEEAGRLDNDPREIIFYGVDKAATGSRTSRSGGSRRSGKHRRG